MFEAVRTGCLLFLSFSNPFSLPIEEGFLELYVRTATGKRVRNLSIACKEARCSTGVSDSNGKARLRLKPQVGSDDWVLLQIVKRRAAPDWVLISPWDDRVNVPSFANKADNITSIVVVLKGDKQILRSGIALKALTERCVGRVAPNADWKITDVEREQVRKEQADAVGLSPEELDQAIREWGRKARDPFERGLMKLYEENYPEAERLLKESYEIRKETFRKASKEYADAAYFLGQSLYEQGKYSESVDTFQEVIALRKDDDNVLIWLGMSLHEAGRYAEAEPLLKRALEITEKARGREHPFTAASLKSLALLYDSQGRYAEAEALLKRALEITEKAFGEWHPSTAATINNLATLSISQGKYTEAEPLLKRMLETTEKRMGKEHLDTAASLHLLADLYRTQGRYAEVEPLLKRMLEIAERALDKDDKDHFNVAVGLCDLAGIYQSQGRYEEAEPLYKRAVEVAEKAVGKDHPAVATVAEKYASLLRKTNRGNEAAKLEARAKEIRDKAKLKN